MRSEHTPSPSAIHAAVRLLGDDDHNVQRMCLRRILTWGESARAAVEIACRDDDARLRSRARLALRGLDMSKAADGFVGAVEAARAGRDPRGVLEAGLSAVHQFVAGDLGHEPDFVGRLDALAAELRPLVERRSTTTAARRLGQLLANQHGLTGRDRGVPIVRHDEILPGRVLEQRLGPSSVLCAIYLLVGRRAGLDLTAVRLPGFFLVRIHGRRRILIDPFHGGRTTTRADCLRYLRRIGDESASVRKLCDVADAEVLQGFVEDLLQGRDAAGDPDLRGALERARAAVQPGRVAASR